MLYEVITSANAHLHWMEALTELYDVTHDRKVRKSLEECLRINVTYFYPKAAVRGNDPSYRRDSAMRPV